MSTETDRTRSSPQLLANAIRALSMDAVQKANSGHPGMPMGMADIAVALWTEHLNHNPANPSWYDRDRFVLSNGHGSMLLYSLLHLSGYDLSLEDIKQFRQLHSKTPGHPEYRCTPGVETTTGPLGQGISNAVGMALGERILAQKFNRPDHTVVDHFTYVFMGDGCLMEGISHEACSLAGTLGLGKLIVFWDDNGISIDGQVDGWFTDDTPVRFRAYNWHVISDVDGHDIEQINSAIETAKAVTDKPTLICCKTIIGWGAPGKQGKESSHGAPLGEEEVEKTRLNIGWPHKKFEIPEEIYRDWDARIRGAAMESEWNARLTAYRVHYPELAAEFERRIQGNLPANWVQDRQDFITTMDKAATATATRKASQDALNGFGPILPELLGGSADLTGSNLTVWAESKGIAPEDFDGNYIYFGVREFAMAAILNGIALHGGFIPYGGTFLVFSDYARNALRLAALTKLRVIYVFTHDSIGLGEDGPTHQPIEHAASLRLIPNMQVWRPCDAVETAVAWRTGIENTTGPTSLLLSRQGLPHQNRTPQQLANIERGGYILSDCEGGPEAILIATGSEVELAVRAAARLKQEGYRVRVVSMPSCEVFDAQDDAYKDSVLPEDVANRVAVEAGVSSYWHKYVGLRGRVIGIDTFGESAPAVDLFEHFGFTVENVADTTRALIAD